MGVASAKIEGRMKRPEYVSAAVRACVEQRDFGFISDKTQKMLRGVFSRTGFTDAYYIGKTGSHMFGTRTKSGTYPITVSGGGQSESTSFSVY